MISKQENLMNYNVCEKILNPILRMLKSTTELCKSQGQ